MYNAHRAAGGIGPSNANNSNNRLSDLFDQIRREFEVHAQDRAGEHDQNSTFVDYSQVIRQRPTALLLKVFDTLALYEGQLLSSPHG